jgi:hypothetical protein
VGSPDVPRTIEPFIFIEGGGGRLIAVVTDCADEDAFDDRPYFGATLSSLEIRTAPRAGAASD